MAAGRWRRALQRPLLPALVFALVVGVICGVLLADEDRLDIGWGFVGHAWHGDAADTRSILTKLFGYQVTILTIVLSLNSPMIQSAANQYSPRLVPLYLRSTPLTRALPMFVLSGTYVLAAVRELGLIPDHGVRPRPVISGAFVLLFFALLLLTIDLVRTRRFMRVEGVLALVRKATLDAHRRLRARFESVSVDTLVDVARAPGAASLEAPAAGHFADLDVRRLVAHASKTQTRVCLRRAIGDYMDAGDVIGWVARDDGVPVTAAVTRELADSIVVTAARDLDCDPILGIRILVDVANRALSSSSNDPHTAKQALQQLRSILREIARHHVGDCSVTDAERRPRVLFKGTSLADYLLLAVEGPLRYSGGDTDVLKAIVDIAREIGLACRTPKDRAAVRDVIGRIVEWATKDCDSLSLAALRQHVEALRAELPEIFREAESTPSS